MSWIAAIGAFLGKLLKQILPGLMNQARKPRKTDFSGHDKELDDDINKSIEDQNK